MDQYDKPERCGFNLVPATNFLSTVAANINNAALSDADFRQFIRNSLDIVDFPRPQPEVMGAVKTA